MQNPWKHVIGGSVILVWLAAGAFAAWLLLSQNSSPDIPCGYYGPTQADQEFGGC